LAAVIENGTPLKIHIGLLLVRTLGASCVHGHVNLLPKNNLAQRELPAC
jgi:hypothetical protein